MGFQGSGRRVSRPGGLEIAGLGSKVRAQGLGFTIYKGLKFIKLREVVHRRANGIQAQGCIAAESSQAKLYV